MNKWIKEALWLVIVVVIPLLYILTGGTSQTFDINVHDTYYVIPVTLLTVIFVVPLLFIIYLLRVVAGRFNNVMANYVFMLATCFFIIFFTYIISYNESQTVEGGWTIYPPLSEMPQVIPVQKKSTGIDTIYLIVIQFILMTLLAFTAFKTGQKIKEAK